MLDYFQQPRNLFFIYRVAKEETATREEDAASRDQHVTRDVPTSRHNDVIRAVQQATRDDVSARTHVERLE